MFSTSADEYGQGMLRGGGGGDENAEGGREGVAREGQQGKRRVMSCRGGRI